MSISIFLPTRKGSQRAKDKNTRKFCDLEGGLLELKLQQLIALEEVEEILLSTNDERSLEIGEKYKYRDTRIHLDVRPEHLATAETDLSDLIQYAAEKVKGDHILWTHVTSPFCQKEQYVQALSNYFNYLNMDYDSLVSGNTFQNFLWDREENDLINRLGERRWPATQDLKPLFEINNAVFLAPREIYLNKKDRLGNRPFLYEMDKISSLDVDNEEDFTIAEAIYDRFFR